MPPRKGIVKSGNAGNSSKSSKETVDSSKVDGSPPPLFPPGSKYPLSLLQERFVCTQPCVNIFETDAVIYNQVHKERLGETCCRHCSVASLGCLVRIILTSFSAKAR